MKKIIIYIILTALLAIYMYSTDFDFSVLFSIGVTDFILLSLVTLLSYINTFYAVDIQLRMMGVNERKSNIVFLALATNLLNYLPAKGGMLSLGTFLKTKKNVPLNQFVFTTMIFYILVTIITVLLSLFFVFDEKIIYFYSRINFLMIIIFFIIVTASFLSAYYFAKRNKHFKLSQYYLLFISNKKLILQNKLNLFYVVLIILSGIALFSLRMYISFSIAGFEISFYQALLIGIIANLSFFLSFTPGGLGVKEGFIAGITFILFDNAGIGVIASLIDRLVNLLYTIITGIISIKILDKRFFSKNPEEK